MKTDIIYLDEMREIALRHPEHNKLQQLLKKHDQDLSLEEIGELLEITKPLKSYDDWKKSPNKNTKRFVETLGGLCLLILGFIVLLNYFVRFL
jgi:hypothetical protein